jgi:hypothetical protein
MRVEDKALYNFLRIQARLNPSLPVEKWQVEDYRALPLSTLFSKLEELQIPMDAAHFLQYAEKCNSPEELLDLLWVKENDLKGRAKAFLILFELWRRLLSQKQSLSVFCDEIDHCIEKFHESGRENDEPLLAILKELEDILDKHVDGGVKPGEIFQNITTMCAYDIENLLYDLIADKIDSGDSTTASELLDGFYTYMRDKKWFDFLRARQVLDVDEEEGEVMMERLLWQLKEEHSIELLIEMAGAILYREENSFFSKVARQACEIVQTEGPFHELLELTAEYFEYALSDEKEQKVRQIIERHVGKEVSEPLASTDPDLALLKQILG